MHIVTSSSVRKLSIMLQLDILKVKFWIFLKDFPLGSSIVGRLLSFFCWFFSKRLKTVRTMNLKFLWSQLHLISVRSQDVLAFATTVEAFVNTARGLFNVNSLFIFLAFDARALKNCIANIVAAKQNALGSTSPPRFAISNSFWCSSNRLSVTFGEVLLEINSCLQDVHFL